MSNHQIVILSPDTRVHTEDSGSEDLIEVPRVGESIVFRDYNIEKVRIMLENSRLGELTKINELQDSVTHHWKDVLEEFGLADHNSMENWSVIKKLLNGESSLTTTDVMEGRMVSTYQAMISSLYEDIGYGFYALFRKVAIFPNIPKYFEDLGIDHLYEQIVFYEYIYSSSVFSLLDKIRWMIDFGFNELINLLDDHHLNIWDSRRDYTSIENYQILGAEYRLLCDSADNSSEPDRIGNLKKMLNLHGQILNFNMDNYSINTDTDIGTLPNMLSIVESYKLSTNKGDYVESTCQQLRKMAKLIGKVSREEDIPMLTIYADYVLVDFMMKLLEEGHADQIGIGLSAQAGIIYTWLVYSSRILKDSNTRYSVITKEDNDIFASHYIQNVYSRHIQIKNLIEPLHQVNIDFESMLYVYLKDHLEMFEIITRNCEFQIVDASVVTYYPTQIMNYIVGITGKSLKNVMKTIRGDIEIDIHLLCEIDNSRLVNLTNIAFKHASRTRVGVANLFSQRVDPMNEDIMCLHELDELNNELNHYEERSLHSVLNAVFFETGSKADANSFFARTVNYPILGVLAYAYLRSFSDVSDAKPLQNYTSYLVSRLDYDRIAPSITDICGCMMFMRHHARYLSGLHEYIEARNEMVDEYNSSQHQFEKLDSSSICPISTKYGIYESDQESDSDSDDFEVDSDDSGGYSAFSDLDDSSDSSDSSALSDPCNGY